MMRGTKTYLFGCHHFLYHPFAVIYAWIKYHKRIPNLWELACIFIHDIGLIGQIDYPLKKDNHWKRGAIIAQKLFGQKGFDLCAGHSAESGYPRSDLFAPDKIWCLFQPLWLLHILHLVEGFYEEGISPKRWQELVKINYDLGFKTGNQRIYLNNRK